MTEQERNLGVGTARQMLEGQLSLTEGCRILASLCPDREYGQWSIILSFDDQAELFPRPDRRVLYSPAYLAKLDRQQIEWEIVCRAGIFGACQWLIEEYGSEVTTPLAPDSQ